MADFAIGADDPVLQIDQPPVSLGSPTLTQQALAVVRMEAGVKVIAGFDRQFRRNAHDFEELLA